MSRHVCPGEGCHRCQDEIDRREFGDERSWDDTGGQDAYERQLDRMGGSL